MEDWIDAAEERGLLLVTANDEADLTTDGCRLFAWMKAAVARSEGKRKSVRQQRAQQQRLELGKPSKDVRLAGSAYDSIRPGKVVVIEGVSDRFNGLVFQSGVRHSVSAGNWETTLTFGHLGSGLYFCECGLLMRSSSGLGKGKGMYRYSCRNACFYRSGIPVDAWVLTVIHARLARPDLVKLLARASDKRAMVRLTREAAELTARLAVHEADYNAGLIDGRRYNAACAKVNVQVGEVQGKQTDLIATESTKAVFGAQDPVAAFERETLDVQRRIISALATVTLHKGKHGVRQFAPESVSVAFR